MNNTYLIQGTKYLYHNDEYNNQYLYPEFQKKIQNFKDLLNSLTLNREAKTFYKFGDGDYYFLKKEPRGSAKTWN